MNPDGNGQVCEIASQCRVHIEGLALLSSRQHPEDGLIGFLGVAPKRIMHRRTAPHHFASNVSMGRDVARGGMASS